MELGAVPVQRLGVRLQGILPSDEVNELLKSLQVPALSGWSGQPHPPTKSQGLMRALYASEIVGCVCALLARRQRIELPALLNGLLVPQICSMFNGKVSSGLCGGCDLRSIKGCSNPALQKQAFFYSQVQHALCGKCFKHAMTITSKNIVANWLQNEASL
eukprot:1146623-Pelagomonas_calceolata.AAC.3